MPLLNKKRLQLTTPPRLDKKRRRKEVYYLKCTDEVFFNYESYINRWSLCHRRIWECELTGRQQLTYQQAKESEQAAYARVEFKFCSVLRKQMLSHIQFQTIPLDALVQNLYHTYLYDYSTGELIHCLLGGHTYLGQIIEKLPPAIKEEVPRQANGRLRFPDAFLHPEPTTPLPPPPPPPRQYRVQLIDHEGHPLEKTARLLEAEELFRDPQYFNSTILQHLIREVATRDSYMGAPWLLKDHVARQYDIPTILPPHLQKAQDTAYRHLLIQPSPSSSSSSTVNMSPWSIQPSASHQHILSHTTSNNGTTADGTRNHSISTSTATAMTTNYAAAIIKETEAEKQARREQHQRLKLQQKLEKERIREERKKQAAVKYPIEDLDLPIYRKDPNHHWVLVDMTPTNYASLSPSSHLITPAAFTSSTGTDKNSNNNNNVRIPYPCGGRGPRPMPTERSSVHLLNDQQFETMMTIWSFLTVFSVPLHLPTMTIETFESSLLTCPASPASLGPLVQSFTSLLNIIIKERQQGTTSDIVNGDHVEEYLQDNAASGSEDDNDEEEEEEDEENDGDEETEGEDDNNDEDDNKKKKKNKKTEDTDSDSADDNIDLHKTRPVTRSSRRKDKMKKNNGTNATATGNHTNETADEEQQGEEDEEAEEQAEEQQQQEDSDRKNSNDTNSLGLGWRDPEPLRLCKGWDKKEIRPDRRNWLVALIGCLNDVATPLLIPGMDALLHHLLPRSHCTIAERDRQFASLDVSRKLQLLSFLMEVVNESLIIKNYMDECQDQLTELRRQKAEWNKEYKLFLVRKAAMEKEHDAQLLKEEQQQKQLDNSSSNNNNDNNRNNSNEGEDDDQDNQDTTNDAAATEDDDENESEENLDDDLEDEEAMASEEDEDDDDDDLMASDVEEDEDDDDDEDDEEDDGESGANSEDDISDDSSIMTRKKRKAKYGQLQRTTARRAKLDKKKKQQEKRASEIAAAATAATTRTKRRYVRKRPLQQQGTTSTPTTPTTTTTPSTPSTPSSVSKVKNKEQRQRLEMRRQMKQEEHTLKRKEEQLERDMRQYMTLRVRPLGKDRFFNRYLYLDNIGAPDHHGTGRLYVQSPSFVDILQMMDRDYHPAPNGVVSGPTSSSTTATATAATATAAGALDSSPSQDDTTNNTPKSSNAVDAPPAWGRGGGREFILELMKEQGLIKERDWLERRMATLQDELDKVDHMRSSLSTSDHLDHTLCTSHPVLQQHLHQQQSGGWWYYYSEPEQIQELLAWLNPKGIREYKLRNEIVKQQYYIMESMEKHDKVEKKRK